MHVSTTWDFLRNGMSLCLGYLFSNFWDIAFKAKLKSSIEEWMNMVPQAYIFQLRYMCELKEVKSPWKFTNAFIMAVFQFEEASNPTQPIEVANN